MLLTSQGEKITDVLLHVLFLWSGMSFLLYNLITENAHSSLQVLLNVLCLGKFSPSLLGEDESLPLWVLVHFLSWKMPLTVRCTIDFIIALGEKKPCCKCTYLHFRIVQMFSRNAF